MAKIGRPKKEIDADLVRKLAARGLPQRDIALIVGCDQTLISKRFSSEYHLGVSQGKCSLRTLMWKQARNGSAPITLRLDDRYFGPLEEEVRKRLAAIEETLASLGINPETARPSGNGTGSKAAAASARVDNPRGILA